MAMENRTNSGLFNLKNILAIICSRTIEDNCPGRGTLLMSTCLSCRGKLGNKFIPGFLWTSGIFPGRILG